MLKYFHTFWTWCKRNSYSQSGGKAHEFTYIYRQYIEMRSDVLWLKPLVWLKECLTLDCRNARKFHAQRTVLVNAITYLCDIIHMQKFFHIPASSQSSRIVLVKLRSIFLSIKFLRCSHCTSLNVIVFFFSNSRTPVNTWGLYLKY